MMVTKFLLAGAALLVVAPAAMAAEVSANDAIAGADIAGGESAVRQVVPLMAHDADGTVSRAAFMAYMNAEYDRMTAEKHAAAAPVSRPVVCHVQSYGWRYQVNARTVC